MGKQYGYCIALCFGAILLCLMLFLPSECLGAGGGPPPPPLGYPWPVRDGHKLFNAYGEAWDVRPHGLPFSPFAYLIHDGIDIAQQVNSPVFAVQSGWVQEINFLNLDSTWSLSLGNNQTGSGPGWVYAHIDSIPGKPWWQVGDHFFQGDTIAVIKHPHLGYDHLHLEYVYGSGGATGWDKHFPTANPLDSLVLDPDDIPPAISKPSILVAPDSLLIGGQANPPLFNWRQADSSWIVNHKVDIAAYVFDRRPDTTAKIMAHQAAYTVMRGGEMAQSQRGYRFTGMIPSFLNQRPLSNAIVDDLYYNPLPWGGYPNPPTDTSYVIFTNAPYDTLVIHFMQQSNFIAYWNTKQKKGSPWNSPDTADGIPNAQFPDDRYHVLLEVKDHQGLTVADTVKVIVNNFPPQVKQTHPDSGAANVPTNDSVWVWFDQPMDTVSAKDAFSLRLKGDPIVIQPIRKYFVGDTLIFVPQDTLQLDTVYVATIDITAKDIADSAMALPYSFPFSTRKTVFLTSFWDSTGTAFALMKYDTTGGYLGFYDLYGSATGTLRVQKIAYDCVGDNFVLHTQATHGARCVKKYAFNGEDTLRFLNDRYLRAVTTDNDALFYLLSHDDGSTYPWVLKTDKNGANPDSFSLLENFDAFGLDYRPWDGLLYVPGYLSGSTHWTRLLRYTKDGILVRNDTIGTTHPQIAATNRMKVILFQGIEGFSSGTLCIRNANNWHDSVLVHTHVFSPLGGDGTGVWNVDTDRSHIYALCETKLSGQSYFWVCVLDEMGNYLRNPILEYPSNKYKIRALAVYPSILGTPGMYEGGGGGGDTDGGPQTAGTNDLLPKTYSLGQSYPNPAGGAVKINYALPKESRVNLRIFNVAGQLVRTLKEGIEKPGYYVAPWDVKDQFGHRVSSGVYLYRMEAGEFRKTRKLVVVR